MTGAEASQPGNASLSMIERLVGFDTPATSLI
jgi:hypothetical protein